MPILFERSALKRSWNSSAQAVSLPTKGQTSGSCSAATSAILQEIEHFIGLARMQRDALERCPIKERVPGSPCINHRPGLKKTRRNSAPAQQANIPVTLVSANPVEGLRHDIIRAFQPLMINTVLAVQDARDPVGSIVYQGPCHQGTLHPTSFGGQSFASVENTVKLHHAFWCCRGRTLSICLSGKGTISRITSCLMHTAKKENP